MIEAFADLAGEILTRAARLGPTRLVAVDGPSGAGKTVFASRLAGALTPPLGSPPPVVHTDDLLDGWSDQFTFWSRLDDWVLSPLRQGRPGRYRRYSWVRRAFTPAWVPVPVAPVLVVEGVSSARAGIRPELTYAVFVTAPTDLRLERAVARDGERLRADLVRWRREERRHFADDDTAARVDLVVDGAPTLRHDPSTSYVRLTPD